MKKVEAGLCVMVLILSAGCVTLPDIAYRQANIKLGNSDQITSIDEAKEDLNILLDTKAFPYFKIENLEAGEFGLVIKGFPVENVNSFGFRGKDISFGHSTVSKDQRQISILFKDIQKIQIFKQDEYRLNENQADKNVEHIFSSYVCAIDGGGPDDSYTIEGSSEQGIRRVASALAFLSKKDVVMPLEYPKIGCKIDRESGAVVSALFGGPLDLSGIPLFSRIASVDGKDLSPNNSVQVLTDLEPGKHDFEFKSPTSLFGSVHKDVFIYASPPEMPSN